MEKVWKQYCPLMKGVCVNGFVKGMPEADSGERTTCAFFMRLAGKDPQTQEDISDPGCAIQWTPIIFLEGNQHMRQVISATDKVATEVRNHHATFVGILPEEARQRLLDADMKVKQLQNGDGGKGS